ncbi:Uncharacterised protein [Pasteurella multocida]|nr:Uncharacterised protein [Pasteurella multocida]
MSFDIYDIGGEGILSCLNPFGTGLCLSTQNPKVVGFGYWSQSLWNRAMSFDINDKQKTNKFKVSIPLEQGYVFRHIIVTKLKERGMSQSLWNRAMSFDDYIDTTTQCGTSQSLWNRAMSFDNYPRGIIEQFRSLNPFGTGLCLSTAGCEF